MIVSSIKKDFISCVDLLNYTKSWMDTGAKTRVKASILLFGIDYDWIPVLENELDKEFDLLFTQDIIQALDYLFQLDIHLIMIDIKFNNSESNIISKFVKSHPDFSHLPIVCFVESNELALKVCSLSCGVDILFDLPMQKDFLNMQVHSLLNNRTKVIDYVLKRHHIPAIKQQSFEHIQFMDKLYALIDDLIFDENITVNTLAEKMNMSRSTLYRKIQDHTSLSLNALIKQFKIKKAANLLIQNKFSIAQVSYMVGYSVQSNFSRDFLKIFGIRPSVFRLKHDEKVQIKWLAN